VKQRVLTALVLIPPVLAVLFSTSPIPVVLLALLFGLQGAYELNRLLRNPLVWPGLALTSAIPLAMTALAPEAPWRMMALGAAGISLLGIVAIRYLANRHPEGTHFLGLIAIGWVIGPFLSLLALHIATVDNNAGSWRFTTPLLLAFLPLWGGDTAAIFAGRAFGKHLLWPDISPNKTWEGALANLVVCIAVSVPLAVWTGYGPLVGAACGIATGVLGQYGDLFESYVKRQAGLKDSGDVLPGHGGILDRIDSLLFTGPAIAVILLLFPTG
jgi:phosphatidate cytidylyltransferase